MVEGGGLGGGGGGHMEEVEGRSGSEGDARGVGQERSSLEVVLLCGPENGVVISR